MLLSQSPLETSMTKLLQYLFFSLKARDRKNFNYIRIATDKLRAEIIEVNERTRTSTEKLTAETQKILAEAKKNNLENHKLALSLLLGVASAVGAGAVIIYCLCYVGGFPSGLTVGDTMFFLFAAVALGIAGLLYSGFGMLVFLPFIFRNKRRKKRHDGAIAGICLFSGVFIPFLVTAIVHSSVTLTESVFVFIIALPTLLFIYIKNYVPEGRNRFLATFMRTLCYVAALLPFAFYGTYLLTITNYSPEALAAALLGGATLTIAISLLDTPPKSPRLNTVNNNFAIGYRGVLPLLFFAIATPFLFSGPFGDQLFRKAVMERLGVYKERAAIVVSSENFETLQSAASVLGLPLLACRDSTNLAVVTNVQVLWHGPGNTSVVDLAKASSTSNSAKVQLKSEGVKLVSGDHFSCIELNEGMFFESNSSKLNSLALPAAKLILDDLTKSQQQGGTIIVSGHADPMARHLGTNEQLALDRACAVAKIISKKDNIWIKNFGSRHPVKECAGGGAGVSQRECNSANRRVEIRYMDHSSKPLGAVKLDKACNRVAA